jgi:hypothetical protein
MVPEGGDYGFPALVLRIACHHFQVAAEPAIRSSLVGYGRHPSPGDALPSVSSESFSGKHCQTWPQCAHFWVCMKIKRRGIHPRRG